MSRLADIGVAIQEWVVTALTTSEEMWTAMGYALESAPAAAVAARVWDSPPDASALMPYLDVNVGVPVDVGTVGLVEVMARAEVTVKVVGKAEAYEDVAPIAVALHNALQAKKNVALTGSGVMLSSQRLRVVTYPEMTGGIEYRHVGGTYEVFAQ